MAVQVKLVDGTLETFDSYRGCVRCGGERDKKRGWDKRCASCGHFEEYQEGHSTYFRMESARQEPECVVSDDGVLRVFKGKTQVGYFPAGSWMTFREV